MANELTNFEVTEFSVCFKDLGGPANEDATIEITKSQEQDTMDADQNNATVSDEADEDFEAFVDEHGEAILNEFDAIEDDDERADAILGLAYERDVAHGAVADATEVVKAMRENSVPKAELEAVKKTLADAGAIIQKAKDAGFGDAASTGLIAEITKANGGQPLSEEAAARIDKIEKAQAAQDRKDAITKAQSYGFGKAETVADLEVGIRKALGDKSADAFVEIVKKAGEIAKGSKMFERIGSDEDADANSPIAKANSGIQAILKANPNMTIAKATTEYYTANPEEYAAYREAQQRAA